MAAIASEIIVLLVVSRIQFQACSDTSRLVVSISEVNKALQKYTDTKAFIL
jgi:hypothetical protein